MNDVPKIEDASIITTIMTLSTIDIDRPVTTATKTTMGSFPTLSTIPLILSRMTTLGTLSRSRTHRPRSTSTPSRPFPPAFLLPVLLFAILTFLPHPAHSQTTAPSTLPQIDFGRMGTVTLTGSFVGLDFYSPDSDSDSGSSAAGGTGSTEGDSLILRRTGQKASVLGRTDEGGSILTVCPGSSTDDDNLEVYVGGNFTRFAGVQSRGLVRVSVPARQQQQQGEGTGVQVAAIGSGADLLGSTGKDVRALYCTDSVVWVGRSASIPGENSNNDEDGNNVLLLDPSTMDLSLPPFTGLNGSVTSIRGSSSDPQGIIFGGSFSTLFRTDGQNATSIGDNETTTTTTLDEILGAYPGAAPFGTVTTGFSRYLTPLSLTNASIDAGPNDSTGASIKDITCPQGDGAGSSAPTETYYGRDGSAVKVTVRLFRELRATGIRLGNSFEGNKGTTGFRVVTIPDNTQRTLIYTDPSSGQNSTCSDSCPLSTNSSIVAQDFMFSDGMESITGFQVYLEQWTGDGVGLSRLQLLSSGGTASAVSAGNYPVCRSGSSDTASSNVEQTGQWSNTQVDTSISGTVQSVAVASVPNGSGDRPSTTWYPYISSSGNYSVYLNIPGCQRMGNCASRTSVDVGVFPYAGSLGYTCTVQQTVDQDTRELIYSGYMQGSQQGAFQSTVRLALGSNPASTSSGRWEVVAGSVTLEYNAAVTQNGTRIPLVTGLNQTVTINSTELGNLTIGDALTRRAFGVFEWTEGGADVDATRVLGNETETDVTRLGFALQGAREGANNASVRAIVTLNDIVYAAGQFADQGNFSNIVALKDGTVTSLAQQGLNGLVTSAVASGDQLFFGGDFTGTAQGSTTLNRLARYDPANGSWFSLAGGVDGVVSALEAGSNDQILVVGNFSNTIDSDGTTTATGGYAVWNTKSETWTTSGIVVGSVNSIALDDDQTFIAGRILGVSDNAVNGIAYLSGSGEDASISAADIDFASNATTSNPARKRSILPHGHPTRTWMNRFSEALRKRQASTPASTPAAVPQVGPEAPTILTAAYWTNSSASGNLPITCIGGNFSLAESRGTSLGFYNQETQTTTPVAGQQPNGIVRSLEVIDDTLVVAGDFVLGEQNSIASYNLASNSWNSAVPGLNNGTGAGDVYVVRKQPDADMLIAAGAFTTAGSLPCVGVCAWDLGSSRWSALGSGLSRGSVRTIEFVDQSLFIAGSFTLSDGTAAYVARYDFSSSSWTALAGGDQLPGPVTAMALDDGDVNKIYAAGVSSNNGDPYVQRWNGQIWETQEPAPLSGTQVSSMVMVPLATEYSDSQMMEKDRMLMVVGSLVLPDSGNSTAALYDGQAWHPYLTSVGRDNNGAGASGLFYSIHDFSFHTRHYLALGLIVLIAIAISTGLIFLFVLLGLLIVFWWRRHRKQTAPPPVVTTLMEKRPSSDYGDTDSLRLRRLDAIQQAVFGSTAVAATSFAAASKAQSPRDMTHDDTRSSFGYDSTSQGHAMGAQTADTHGESSSPSHMGRPTTVKYNFEAVDPAELSVCEGDHVNVLEEDESEQWWYVRDREGREGVVPASYLW